MLRSLAIAAGFVTVPLFTVKIFGTSDGLRLTLNIDFIPFQALLILFQSILK